QRARLEEPGRNAELPGLDAELDLLEVRRELVVLRSVGADVVREGGRRGDHEREERQHAEGHRRASLRTTRPASHHSATIIAPPNGIQTNHSAIDFPLSSP